MFKFVKNDMANSRIKYSKKNILSGIFNQMIRLGFAFVVRTAIIYVLGAEYQGLNGLFSSILQVLNLTDLGFSTAITYILYKPISRHDTVNICALVNYLKRIYLVIGIVILVLGLCITPFLSYLIKGDVPSDVNIYLLFLVYILNSAVSYLLFSYKSTLITAMQRQDVVSNIYTAVSVVTNVVQLILLSVFKNYYAYIVILPVGTIANSILLQVFSKKIFPEIRPDGEIEHDTKKELSKQVRAVFIGKVGDVARNSFDNIVLSMMFGLLVVTIYGNYYYIFSAVYGSMSIIVHGIMASVGNSIASESVDKNYNDMKVVDFLFMWIVSWCSICMLCLYQHFMLIWMNGNQKMLLSNFNMVLFCVYFYFINMTYVRSMYLDGFGLFHECRFAYVAEALLNLILNFVLGYFFGVSGIIIATILTILILNFITRTNILFRNYFKRKPSEFYLNHFFYFCATTVAAVVSYLICSLVGDVGVIGLVIKLLICLILPNLILFLFYYKRSEFKFSLKLVKRILNAGN